MRTLIGIGLVSVIAGAALIYAPSSTATFTIRAEPSEVSENQDISASQEVIVPENMWVTSIRAQMEGAPISTLHHAAIWRTDRKDPLCPLNDDIVLTTSPDSPLMREPLVFKKGYALFLPKGTTLVMHAMFHPAHLEHGASVPDAAFEINFRYRRTGGYVPVRYYLLRAEDTPCSTDTFAVPPHSTITKDSGTQSPGSITFSSSGTIVFLRGHFHPWDGGKELSVFLNGEPRAQFMTREDDQGWLIPARYETLPIRRGDRMTFETRYSNTDPKPLEAMGHVGFFFAEGTTE